MTSMDGLIPHTSPLLQPARHRNSSESFHYNARNEDIPDDLIFLQPGDYRDDEFDDRDNSDRDNSDDEDDEDDLDLEDFTLEDGHIEGVPACNSSFSAKQYETPEFSMALLELLRDDLQIPGWETLPSNLPASLIHIHKVSGSLTNAVFFISIPATTFDLSPDAHAASPVDEAHDTPKMGGPATVLSELERGRATPTPGTPTSGNVDLPSQSSHGGQQQDQPRQVTFEAPTLLLRIYGPSSGSLISRRVELHILHTLSSEYGIGPRVLGTFANGRVEEYFHSRALHKEEMRDPRISRWIGRRMRELHRVELDKMEPPDDGRQPPSRSSSRSRSGAPERPSLENAGRGTHGGSGGGSMYSTSSGSSIFSFGAMSYASSNGSYSSSYGGSQYGTPLVSSPLLMAQGDRRGESRAASKKRSRSSLPRGRRTKDKLGVWENITRWTREAKLVLKALDELSSTPGFDSLFHSSRDKSPSPAPALRPEDEGNEDEEHVIPLVSPERIFAMREEFNLPLFEQQVKLYRTSVRRWEKQEGKSKRVFSHNDTQYGNLLIQTPSSPEEEQELEKGLQAPHQQLHVIDFEYASANPRAYDIANHFIEWRADYHHSTLSHSLFDHNPYPTPAERARFLRAYIGCDGGLDTADAESTTSEDARVARLEDEVRLWEPASHALWAVWGIVQGKEDLLARVEVWKKACAKAQSGGGKAVEEAREMLQDVELGGEESAKERPTLTRGKSGEEVEKDDGAETDADEEEEEGPLVVDFDYFSYALCRMKLFRQELKQLGIV